MTLINKNRIDITELQRHTSNFYYRHLLLKFCSLLEIEVYRVHIVILFLCKLCVVVGLIQSLKA